jgi:hypothetical protein
MFVPRFTVTSSTNSQSLNKEEVPEKTNPPTFPYI